MRRREFIAGLGACCSRAASAQSLQVIGFLSGRSQEEASGDTAAFHQGLSEMGYVAGRNVALEYRWAEGRNDLLPGRLPCSQPLEAITRPWLPNEQQQPSQSCSRAVPTQSWWASSRA
jgi:hypothetical protein